MIGAPRLSYHEGDHVCTLFSSPEEQLRAAIEYIRGGLSRRERCLWVSCERPVADFRAALNEAEINVEAEEARGALLILCKEEGHLKGGSFDPDRMIAMLHQAVKDALDAGFTGLCAGGDMSWLLDEAPGSERLVEYEARLNHFYKTSHALGLCMYNVRTMPAALLDHCMATHPTVRMEDSILLENPFYELPEIAVSRIARPQDVDRKIREIHAARSA
jgi:hypothetical protein